MADRGLIHYQPVTGPIWTEPVASRLAWLPTGQPAVRLERRVPSESVYPPFYELYKPELLHWLPSGRWPVIAEVRKLGDFQQPAFDALYKPEHLEWIPKGMPPQILEVRKPSDFVGPAFDALYKPAGLQWLFEGQLSVRGIPYAIQSLWTIDPTALFPTVVVFDPQFFPFETTGAPLPQALRGALQSTFDTPPLPPGPDVVPAATGPGGSSARHPRRVYEKDKKRHPDTFPEHMGVPDILLEQSPEPVPAAADAAPPIHVAPVREALAARLPAVLPLAPAPPLQVARDDDEDDLLLLD